MGIDYEKIKKYLTVFHEHQKPLINTIELFEKLNYNKDNQLDCQEVYHYINILNDQELIECIGDTDNLGFVLLGNGQIKLRIVNYRLTILGHQSYEVLTSNKIWNKINNTIVKLGEAGLKQIPSIGMKILIQNIL